VADVAERLGVSTVDSDVANIGRQGAGVIAVGRLLDRALRRMGVVPDAVAGHSIGEWSAMISSGLFSGTAVDEFLAGFDPDAVRVPGLVFAAIGASADRVATAIADRPGVVLSHDNAPNQSIVRGPADQIDALVQALRRDQCSASRCRSGPGSTRRCWRRASGRSGPPRPGSSRIHRRYRCGRPPRRRLSRPSRRRSASCSCATWSSRCGSGP
jgi:hypothetical protein